MRRKKYITLSYQVQVRSQNQQNQLNQLYLYPDYISKVISETDMKYLQKSVQSLKQQFLHLNEILAKINSQISSTQQNLQQMEEQQFSLIVKIDRTQKQMKRNNKPQYYNNKSLKYQKEYLQQWRKRINIAEKVDLTKFLDEQMDQILENNRKSLAHLIFKWIFVCLYGQQLQNKYYWPNFRSQVLLSKSKSQDLNLRLGKINSSKATSLQISITKNLLQNFDQIYLLPEISKCSHQAYSLYKIVQIYFYCYEISKKIKYLENQIEISKQFSLQNIKEIQEWKSATISLNNKIRISKEFIQQMNQIFDKIKAKRQRYEIKYDTSLKQLNQLKGGKKFRVYQAFASQETHCSTSRTSETPHCQKWKQAKIIELKEKQSKQCQVM